MGAWSMDSSFNMKVAVKVQNFIVSLKKKKKKKIATKLSVCYF